jgi:hypothetical protein
MSRGYVIYYGTAAPPMPNEIFGKLAPEAGVTFKKDWSRHDRGLFSRDGQATSWRGMPCLTIRPRIFDIHSNYS